MHVLYIDSHIFETQEKNVANFEKKMANVKQLIVQGVPKVTALLF